MADAQLKLSRRALLGAACAGPVLGAVEGPLSRHSGLDPESMNTERDDFPMAVFMDSIEKVALSPRQGCGCPGDIRTFSISRE